MLPNASNYYNKTGILPSSLLWPFWISSSTYLPIWIFMHWNINWTKIIFNFRKKLDRDHYRKFPNGKKVKSSKVLIKLFIGTSAKFKTESTQKNKTKERKSFILELELICPLNLWILGGLNSNWAFIKKMLFW